MAGMDGFSQQAKLDKWLRNLEDDMSDIVPFILNKNVTDIAIGLNGEVIVEGFGMDKTYTGIFFDNATITRIIYATAAVLEHTINPDDPVVEGTIKIKEQKIRVEGILPPRASHNPMYFIRRPPERIFTLENYLESGGITQERYALLIEHIKKRSNILIGGETGSGKTTLLNACIDKMREFTPDDRFYIVEDAGEIQCNAKDVCFIDAKGKYCVNAVASALRCNVSRIIFGELRFGDVTNELLKAWNSGHTGGISTTHANSALTMLERIRSLLREVIQFTLPDISQSIQLLVHMKRLPDGKRIVNEIIETNQMNESSFMEDLEMNNLIR